MISYKRYVLEKQNLSEVKMGRGSSICERLRKKIVEYFKNNVPQRQIAKALQITSSAVHNIIKRFRETGEISVRKGQRRRPLLDACGFRALRRHCITHRHDCINDITKWAQEYFQKPLSINTIRRAISRRQLKLYHAKRKPYVNMVQKRRRVLWAKAHLKCTISKWNSVFWSDESDGMMVHKCIQYGQLACFGRLCECLKVYKGYRTTYAALQTTSISGKALYISAGQCKTTYCSYYNSMASS